MSEKSHPTLPRHPWLPIFPEILPWESAHPFGFHQARAKYSQSHSSLILRLAATRVIIDLDVHGLPCASVASATHERKSKTHLIAKPDGRILLKHNSFTEDIPLSIIFKAMGIESEQEQLQMICTSKDHMNLMVPSMRECMMLNIHCQGQALEYCASKFKSSRHTYYQNQNQQSDASSQSSALNQLHKTIVGHPMFRTKVDEARDVLAGVILSHVPAPHYNFREKAFYLSTMTRRLLDAIIDRNKVRILLLFSG